MILISRILISALYFLFSFHPIEGQSMRTLYTSHARDNWFMGGGVGNSIYLSEDIYHNRITYSDIIIPYVNINGGKWITPSIGLRLNGGFCSLAGINYNIKLNGQPSPVRERVNLLESHLDLMVDLFNLFDRYRERKFTFVTYAGPGATKTLNCINYPQSFHLVFKAGGILKYNVSRALNVFTDIQGTLLPARFEQKKDLDYDGIVTVKAGVSYTFKGKRRGFMPVQFDLSEAIGSTKDD